MDVLRLNEALTRNITGEQSYHFAAQIFITSAGFVEERLARIRRTFKRRVIQPFNLFPTVTLHLFAPRSVSTAARICPGETPILSSLGGYLSSCDADGLRILFSVGRPRNSSLLYICLKWPG